MKSGEFVDALVDVLSGEGIGGRYDVASGLSLQVATRRVVGNAEAIAVFTPIGGPAPAPRDEWEQYGFQVLVDAETAQLALDHARVLYERMHAGFDATCVSGEAASFEVLWVRSITGPPQVLGNGPGSEERWLVTTNYSAFIVKA